MSGTLLRSATTGDLAAIVRVFLRCWEESYRLVLRPEVLSTMDEQKATALWARVLRGAAAGEVVVAVDGDDLLGVTRFFVTGDTGHVASLYVSPDAQGRGLGRSLLAAAEAELRHRGCATASLWVFGDNEPSIAFYRANGWESNGETRVEEQFGAREMSMTKRIG